MRNPDVVALEVSAAVALWGCAMTVSIRRMSLGAGFEYLMSSVARGDGASPSSALTAYYAESGTPVGRFLGAGLAGLANGAGVSFASEVSEEALWRLLGMMADPVTGDPLGRRPTAWPKSMAKRIEERISALPAQLVGVERAAAVGRIEAEERKRESTIARPVAAFDLTFSVPKSVSVVWALADAATQETIYRAHKDAILVALQWAEKNIVFTRTGAGGAVQEPVRGVVAAAFDHWDSRAGDPHLHTHLVVANRVQTADGTWRSIDSKTLFRYTVALSELHEGVLQDILTDRLGYGWTEHSRRHSSVPRHDIAGVPVELIERFSQRATAIETDAGRLVASFAASHGRQPTAAETLRLRQQATLQTRPDKQHRTLRELIGEWRARASDHTRGSPEAWTASLRARIDLPALTHDSIARDMLAQVGALALTNVSTKRATFRHANVLAEIHRLLHGSRFASPRDRLGVAETAVAIALEHSVHLNPSIAPVHRGAELYTTQAIFDAEQRLLDAGQKRTAPAVSDTAVAEVVAAASPALSADQRAVVSAVATSGRVLDLLIGPAGTGKTTTLRALRSAWETTFGPGTVVGLAPSAAAAQVLSEGLGVATENTSKWLHEHAQTPDRQTRIDALERDLARCSTTGSARALRLAHELHAAETIRDRWTLAPGLLLILDEASLADTASLDALTAHARTVGAKILLVGDPFQLSPVDAGGALAMLAHDRPDLLQLREVHRFDHDWERAASVLLRHGDTAAIDTYTAHHRIRAGTRAEVLQTVYAAWRRDTDAGKTSLMIAADRDTVAALNHRARTDRILTGHVSIQGVPIATRVAGVGDRIITRRNDRTLRTKHGWVRNGDTWTVTQLHDDGSITVTADRKTRRSAVVHLPGAYVQAHAELGYAATAHTAQGRTTDTAHSVISPNMTREALYVSATRGRSTNTLNVITDHDTDDETGHGTGIEGDLRDVLLAVLRRTEADTSAHTAMTHEPEPLGSGFNILPQLTVRPSFGLPMPHAVAVERRTSPSISI